MIHLILLPRNYIEYEVVGLLRNQPTDGEWQKNLSKTTKVQLIKFNTITLN